MNPFIQPFCPSEWVDSLTHRFGPMTGLTCEPQQCNDRAQIPVTWPVISFPLRVGTPQCRHRFGNTGENKKARQLNIASQQHSACFAPSNNYKRMLVMYRTAGKPSNASGGLSLGGFLQDPKSDHCFELQPTSWSCTSSISAPFFRKRIFAASASARRCGRKVGDIELGRVGGCGVRRYNLKLI